MKNIDYLIFKILKKNYIFSDLKEKIAMLTGINFKLRRDFDIVIKTRRNEITDLQHQRTVFRTIDKTNLQGKISSRCKNYYLNQVIEKKRIRNEEMKKYFNYFKKSNLIFNRIYETPIYLERDEVIDEDWNFYSKGYHRRYGPKKTVLERYIYIKNINGIIFTHNINRWSVNSERYALQAFNKQFKRNKYDKKLIENLRSGELLKYSLQLITDIYNKRHLKQLLMINWSDNQLIEHFYSIIK